MFKFQQPTSERIEDLMRVEFFARSIRDRLNKATGDSETKDRSEIERLRWQIKWLVISAALEECSYLELVEQSYSEDERKQ